MVRRVEHDRFERFNRAYYERFYRNPATRSASAGDDRRQAEFVAAFLRHQRVSVGSIVDVGCGLGRLLGALGEAFPEARVHGVDPSVYLCGEFGWERGALPGWRPGEPFDLVVCNDVVPYLDDDDADAAIDALGEAAGKALYFGALTTEDLALCDLGRTDTDVHLRRAAWYRRRLGRRFEAVGGGLWLKKPVRAAIWSLDRP